MAETVAEALRQWRDVWVVVDGSDDGSAATLLEMTQPGLRVLVLSDNSGKGAAVRHGLLAAQAEGFTHVLTLDADGQHLAADVPVMIALSVADPGAMVMGTPIFGHEAPLVRVWGRRASNVMARLCIGGPGIGDALYGMRVYPIEPLLAAFAATRFMRRYDFDAEAAVRLCRMGVRPVNMATPVRYFARGEGGVSHFRYLRDNAVLAFMFARLLLRI